MFPRTHLTPEIRKLLEQRKIHQAYLLAIKQNPPDSPFFGVSEENMAGAAKATTPALSFCSKEQLFELQTVLALWYADCGISIRRDLKWKHPMPPLTAFKTLLTAYQIKFNLSEWRRNGIVLRVAVRNSITGTCPCCAAMAGEYDIKDVPAPPYPGCTNTDRGCCCIIVGTEIKKTNP